MANNYHLPVMLTETISGLCLRADGTYVDATFGGGGHSRAIMQGLDDNGRLLAFDQDADALANAIDDRRFTLLHENFRYMKNHLRMQGVRAVDGVLADLGVSSHQFDEASRGFSTRFDAALDLRMDQRGNLTASDLVNSASEEALATTLRLYGELPNARQMAHAITEARRTSPIETTRQLCAAVERHLPRGYENKYLAMLFQALRIEVNGELDALREMLAQATELLQPGGRLVVIAYHSLEDRLVKNFMRTGNCEGEVKKDFYGNLLCPLQTINRKPITPSDEELQRNPRSRSAKLRIAEKKKETQ